MIVENAKFSLYGLEQGIEHYCGGDARTLPGGARGDGNAALDRSRPSPRPTAPQQYARNRIDGAMTWLTADAGAERRVENHGLFSIRATDRSASSSVRRAGCLLLNSPTPSRAVVI
ncbi:MAG: hypothetical protein P9E88_06165 [Candidatus Competibacter sp.]|nr:hypothetical protein [Candidatus Competibacter sp.]